MLKTLDNTKVVLDRVLTSGEENSNWKQGITVQYNSNDSCLEDIICRFDGIEAVMLKEDFDPTNHTFMYDSRVAYHCGIGREFAMPGTDTTVLTQKFTCNWDQSWQPGDQVWQCKCKKRMCILQISQVSAWQSGTISPGLCQCWRETKPGRTTREVSASVMRPLPPSCRGHTGALFPANRDQSGPKGCQACTATDKL